MHAPPSPEELDRILAIAERLGASSTLESLDAFGRTLAAELAFCGVRELALELVPGSAEGGLRRWSTPGFGGEPALRLELAIPSGPVGRLALGFERPPGEEARAMLGRLERTLAYAGDNIRSRLRLDELNRHLAGERDRHRLLLEINNRLVTHLEPRALFNAISGALRGHLHHDYLSLAILEPDTDEVRIQFVDFPTGKGYLNENKRLPRRMLPSAQAYLNGRPLRVGLEQLLSASPELREKVHSEGLQTMCCVPLVSRNRVLGALNFGSRREDAFNPEEIELLERVAAQVALSMDNAFAYEQIQALKDKLAEEKLYLEEEVGRDFALDEIVGRSAALQKVLKQVRAVADSGATVLLLGETGTGKELMARALHDLSPRRERTFVKLNCAAIPFGLVESELFGHEKGAFTGAIAQKKGRMELADGGSLFLDEVGELPLELQPKLLRALQERAFERLGGTRTLNVDLRLIAATNRDLSQMVAEGSFRSDLYYRLNVFPIRVPPLRERKEDIPALVRYFAQKHAHRLGRRIESIPSRAMEELTAWPWPGNIRELENFIERSVILSRGTELQVPAQELRGPEPESAVGATLAQAEREHILKALKEARGRVGGPAGAAARLGLKRTTLQSRMKKLGIADVKN